MKVTERKHLHNDSLFNFCKNLYEWLIHNYHSKSKQTKIIKLDGQLKKNTTKGFQKLSSNMICEIQKEIKQFSRQVIRHDFISKRCSQATILFWYISLEHIIYFICNELYVKKDPTFLSKQDTANRKDFFWCIESGILKIKSVERAIDFLISKIECTQCDKFIEDKNLKNIAEHIKLIRHLLNHWYYEKLSSNNDKIECSKKGKFAEIIEQFENNKLFLCHHKEKWPNHICIWMWRILWLHLMGILQVLVDHYDVDISIPIYLKNTNILLTNREAETWIIYDKIISEKFDQWILDDIILEIYPKIYLWNS